MSRRISKEELEREAIEDLNSKIATFDRNVHRYKEEMNNLKGELTRKEEEISLVWEGLDMTNHIFMKLHTELSAVRAENYKLREDMLEKHLEKAKLKIMLAKGDDLLKRRQSLRTPNTDIEILEEEINTSQETQVEMKINDLSGHMAPVRRLVPFVKSNPECLENSRDGKRSEQQPSTSTFNQRNLPQGCSSGPDFRSLSHGLSGTLNGPSHSHGSSHIQSQAVSLNFSQRAHSHQLNTGSAHTAEDDEMWREIIHQQSETIVEKAKRRKIVQEEEEKRFKRAKLRKEEEEKQYEESKQMQQDVE